MRVAIVGAGRLGEALLEGLAAAGALAGVVATVRRRERVTELSRRFAVRVELSNAEAVRDAELVVVALRHTEVAPVLAEIAPALPHGCIVVSLALGVPLEALEAALPGVPVLRGTANIAVATGAGAVALAGNRIPAAHRARARAFFDQLGRVYDCAESQLDAFNAVLAAGPALLAHAAAALTAASGLAPDVAAQTLRGLAELLRERTPDEVVREIAAPGGSTEAALAQLASLPGLYQAAFEAALARARRRARPAQRPPPHTLRLLEAAEVRTRAHELGALLHDCVEGGASVGFMAGFSLDAAHAFFLDVARAVEGGRRLVAIAELDGRMDATAQLVLHAPVNQPHRCELAKMLVHRRARNAGLARALFARIEDEARVRGKTLLTFDTVSGSAAERLYLSCGAIKAGEIPGYALLPDGRPCATSVFFKRL